MPTKIKLSKSRSVELEAGFSPKPSRRNQFVCAGETHETQTPTMTPTGGRHGGGHRRKHRKHKPKNGSR
jgi:hypothetical protein